jgi:hypothetical protein
MQQSVEQGGKVQLLFQKTKLVCFGRYALEVPEEAELIVSDSDIEVLEGGPEVIPQRVSEDIATIKSKRATAEIVVNAAGPITDSWQLRFYEDDIAKSFGLIFFTTYVSKNKRVFIIGDAASPTMAEASVVARQARHALNVRPREIEEIPKEPGFCFNQGFMADNLYEEQEMTHIGLHFPSLPDVTFSVSSNKDAYADYDKEEYESRWRSELSLLNRISQAKKDQPGSYPSRQVLREGKRTLHHWKGEESLFKRPDGAHELEWALVGTPRDIANPSEFHAVLFTKVEADTVGAAKSSSLSDDEAVALFDKLLGSLKFRVRVPGAPEGSYYYDSEKVQPPAGKK